MKIPFVLFLMAALGSAVLVALPGQEDVFALSLIVLAGAFALIVIAAFQGLRHGSRDNAPFILLDGSNIMHWRRGEPDLGTVCDVVRHLEAKGFRPGVVFDANAGYKLDGRYLHHPTLARKLGLPRDQVMVVNKGEIADGMILRAAQDYEARVVSNDRFRDWADQFPKVREPGFLISGGFREGALRLDL